MKAVELVKKGMMIGLGAASMSTKRAAKVVSDLKKGGKLSEAEGKKLAKHITQKSQRHAEHIRRVVKKEVEANLKRLGVATQKDLQKLKKELKTKKR